MTKAMASKIASLLDVTMVEIDGTQGSTRGKPYEKYLVPPTGAAAGMGGVDGDPALAVLMWRKVLSSPGAATAEPIKKPEVGLLTVWPDGTALLAIDQKDVVVHTIPRGARVEPVDARVKSFPGSNPSFGMELTHPDLGAPAWFLGVANRISAYTHPKVAPRFRDKIVTLLTQHG